MRRLFWAMVLANVAVLVWSATQFPDRVASHFGAGNAADSFSSRGSLLTFMAILIGAMAALFAGMAEWMTRSMPMSMINLPHKQRWVDAGQESQLRRMIAEDLYLIGAATMGLILAMQVLTVEANRHDPPVLSAWSWVVIAVFAAGVLGYSAWMTVVKYRRPPAD